MRSEKVKDKVKETRVRRVVLTVRVISECCFLLPHSSSQTLVITAAWVECPLS